MGVGSVVALVIVLMLIGGVCLLAGHTYRHPLRVFSLLNRRRLARAGLVRRSIPSPAGDLVYWIGGKGQALVLLHGAGDEAGTFAGVVERLLTRFRVVVPDLAGHGMSGPAEGPLPVGTMLAGLTAVMEREVRDPAILAGNSLGAWLAALYARANPARVARLVLVNGGPIVGDRPDLDMMPTSRAEAAVLMTQLRDPRSAPIAGFVLDDIVRAAGTGPIARVAQAAPLMAPYLLDGKLHEFTVPADLIWGESDKLLSLAYARKLMAGLPASRLTTIPSCGHVPHQECPSMFVSALLDVLQAPPPARSQTAGPAGSVTGGQ